MKARTLLLVAVLTTALAAAAGAAPLIPELRPRGGLGYDPDGPVAGLQAILRGRVLGFARLAPSVDVGFLDGSRTTAYNVDLLTETLALPGSGIGLYLGGGATLVARNGDAFDDSDTGWTLVLGADVGRHLFAEARFGQEDMPELRMLAGLRLLLR